MLPYFSWIACTSTPMSFTFTRFMIFFAPPPEASWRKMYDSAVATPVSATASRFASGTKPRFTRSLGTWSNCSDTKWEMYSMIAYCCCCSTVAVSLHGVDGGTISVSSSPLPHPPEKRAGPTHPQSRMHRRPSAVRSRFPGCGSACSTPVSRSMVR